MNLYSMEEGKVKHNITINAGFVGKLMLEGLDSCDVMTFLQFLNRLHYYGYSNIEEGVSLTIEVVNGESE